MLIVLVQYVNGERLIFSPDYWPTAPGEGVDYVEIIDITGKVRIASASLYWLYLEGDAVVVGWGSVRYDPNPLTEIVFRADTQTERRIPYMPDLRIVDIKLGHWWPGTSEPA